MAVDEEVEFLHSSLVVVPIGSLVSSDWHRRLYQNLDPLISPIHQELLDSP